MRTVCIVRHGCPSPVSPKRRESSGRPTRTRVTMRRKPIRTSPRSRYTLTGELLDDDEIRNFCEERHH